MKNARGFTLVEILVVVVIITILATIGTLTYAGFQSQSRDQKRSANANVIADSLERYYEKNGEYPSVADVTNTNVSQVKTLLNISDVSALVMPNAPSDITNSLKPAVDDENLTPGIIAYDANVGDTTNKTVCQQTGGGCDSFVLRWKEEAGNVETISSRNKDRIGVLQKPQDPIMTASLSGGNVVGTITHVNDTQPVCSLGTVEYKILSDTKDFTPNWANATWQTSNTKVITSPTPSTEYFFYAIARCTSPDGGDIENSYVAKDSFYYTLATMTASWNGTTAQGKIGPATTTPLCPSGQITSYFIQSKVDTVSAEGQWLPTSQTWNTSDTVSIASAANPRKISFRGQARCDVNASTLGTPSPVSNTDVLISAPAQPSLSQPSLSGSTLTWTWNSVTCPKTTPAITTQYNGAYTGGFAFAPNLSPVTSTSLALAGAYKDGSNRGLRITASCGNVTPKVLASPPSETYQPGSWPANMSPGRGKLYTEYSSGSYARGRTRLQSSSASNSCDGNTYRSVMIQFARNKTGDDSTGDWGTYYNGSWTGGDIIVEGPTNLIATVTGAGGNNTTLETRADVYCYNPYTGGRSPQRLYDRYGILRIIGNSDSNPKPSRYYVSCTGQSLNGNGDPNLAHCRGGYGWSDSNAGMTLNGQANAWQTDW